MTDLSLIGSRLRKVLTLYKTNDHSHLRGLTGTRQKFQELVISSNYVFHLLVRSTPKRNRFAELRSANSQIDIFCGHYKHRTAKNLGKLLDGYHQLYGSLDRLSPYTKTQFQNIVWNETEGCWFWQNPTSE